MDLEILILSEVSQMEEDTHHIISLTYGILQEMATHSSMLAWKIPWARSLGGATVHGVAKQSDMTELQNNNMWKTHTKMIQINLFTK